MFKTKDFILMDVFYIDGKKIGTVKDIIINLNEKKVLGVSISSNKIFEKTVNVLRKNIISLNENIITEKTVKGKFLCFNDVKNMDVISRDGNILGATEDILFDEKSFEIKAVIVSSGFIKNFFEGKKIIPIKEMIAGDESFIKLSKDGLNMLSVPHKLFMEVDEYETKV